MVQLKEGISSNGRKMHYSVGAIIKKEGKFLLVDRMKEPLGFAGSVGHIDLGEEPTEALKREIKEETGLDLINSKLLFYEELSFEPCSRKVKVHFWYLYECEVTGEIKLKPDEEKSIDWYTPEQMKKLKFEKAWEHWFKKLGIL